MSKYTTEIRFIVESFNNNTSSVENTVDDMIINALPNIFNFNYPIFDETYRTALEHKIIRHFYTREIGFETVGLWQLKLNDRLNMIMPYYNQLYKSALLDIDPLNDMNVTKQFKRDNDEVANLTDDTTANTNGTSDVTGEISNTGESTSTATDTAQLKHADTPQGALSNLDYYSAYDNNTNNTTGSGTSKDSSMQTSTNTIQNTDKRNRTSTNKVTNTENYIETVIGNSRMSTSELLLKYRETFLNIDMMVINELNDLFMQLW